MNNPSRRGGHPHGSPLRSGCLVKRAGLALGGSVWALTAVISAGVLLLALTAAPFCEAGSAVDFTAVAIRGWLAANTADSCAVAAADSAGSVLSPSAADTTAQIQGSALLTGTAAADSAHPLLTASASSVARDALGIGNASASPADSSLDTLVVGDWTAVPADSAGWVLSPSVLDSTSLAADVKPWSAWVPTAIDTSDALYWPADFDSSDPPGKVGQSDGTAADDPGENIGTARHDEAGHSRQRWGKAYPEITRENQEVRGLWVVRHTLGTPEGVRAVVSAAAENNLNALFVQVRGRGEAFYTSVIEPRARRLNEADLADFDPLELIITLAHEAGLEVHAWINVFFTWSEEDLPESSKHVINRRPDWITADANGVGLDKLSRGERRDSYIEGIYLSPGIPEVRRYIADVAKEIVSRYPVDGLHLDYVRYPGGHTGLDEYSRARFREAHLFDPLEFLSWSGGSGLFCGPLAVADIGGLWEAWRAEQVTELVSLLSRELRVLDRDIVLSAAVRPSPGRAVREYGQDWVRWLKEGYVDLVAPMIYTRSTVKFFNSLRTMKRAVPDSLQRHILAGVSLYNQEPRFAAEKIEVARAADIGGFVLFSYDSAVGRKGAGYLPFLKAKVLGGDPLDRTALGR